MSRRKRAKEFASCQRCGRPLSDPDSRVRGYGPKCFHQSALVVRTYLEAAGQLSFPLEVLRVRSAT